MTKNKIFEALCYYDERSPNYNKDWPKNSTPCRCSNCFRDRSKLAIELLKQKEFMLHTAHALDIMNLKIQQRCKD